MPTFNFNGDKLKACYTSIRDGETKFGESLSFANDSTSFQNLLNNPQKKYFIFGIPEDIGVQGNYGLSGARNGWKAFIKSFCNLQVNGSINPDPFALVGEFNFDDLYATEQSKTVEGCWSLTQQIDVSVSKIANNIKAAGKIPIAIGGGHNNAYGMLQGVSAALGKSINCWNIDAHADLRKREGRHSGNGFNYALEAGYLKKYHVSGLQLPYLNKYMESLFSSKMALTYTSLPKLITINGIKQEIDWITNNLGDSFGLEIDTDVVENFPSSASSGYGIQFQQLVHLLTPLIHKAEYLHICEAAPSENNIAEMNQVGKCLANLVLLLINQMDGIHS